MFSGVSGSETPGGGVPGSDTGVDEYSGAGEDEYSGCGGAVLDSSGLGVTAPGDSGCSGTSDGLDVDNSGSSEVGLGTGCGGYNGCCGYGEG